jgi:hypothetical protein
LTGDVDMYVRTKSYTGVLADATFFFTLYLTPPGLHPASIAGHAGASYCEFDPSSGEANCE